MYWHRNIWSGKFGMNSESEKNTMAIGKRVKSLSGSPLRGWASWMTHQLPIHFGTLRLIKCAWFSRSAACTWPQRERSIGPVRLRNLTCFTLVYIISTYIDINCMFVGYHGLCICMHIYIYKLWHRWWHLGTSSFIIDHVNIW